MLPSNIGSKWLLVAFALTATTSAAQAKDISSSLSLEQAIKIAVKRDVWHQSADLKQQALLHKAKAADTLADPKVSIELMNMPTDTFNFEQEAMTQFRVAATQALPRGDSLSLKQAKVSLAASELPILKQVRQARVTEQLSLLWLQAQLAQSNIALIEQDMPLFEQMIDIAKASYSSALGNTRQQDVISAQVELLKLQNKLYEQQQKLVFASAKLGEWLDVNLNNVRFSLPDLITTESKLKNLLSLMGPESTSAFYQTISNHPELKALQIQHKVAEQNIELRQQEYKPQWSVKASYGYRDQPSAMADRADLVSVGVTFDLPLFTANKQDQNLAAARAQAGSVKLNQELKSRELQAGLAAQLQQYQTLTSRQALFDKELLVQLQQQSEAALTAYTNDDGQFSEVLQARISELDTKLLANKITNELQQSIIKSQYYLVQSIRFNQTSVFLGKGDK